MFVARGSPDVLYHDAKPVEVHVFAHVVYGIAVAWGGTAYYLIFQEFLRTQKQKPVGAGGTPKVAKPTNKKRANVKHVDTSLFVTIILGLLALVGLLLQWNGVLTLEWLVSAILYALITIIAVISFLRWETASEWSRAWRYAAAFTVTIVFVAIAAVGITTQYRREHPPIEANIKKWAAANGWKVTALSGSTIAGRQLPFDFMITLPSTATVRVFINSVNWPDILQMQSKIFAPPEDLLLLNQLNRADMDAAMQEFKVEMTKQKINWKIDTYSDQPMDKFPGQKFAIHQQSVLVANPIPLEGLTEYTFSKAVAETDNNVAFVYNQMDVILKRYVKQESLQQTNQRLHMHAKVPQSSVQQPMPPVVVNAGNSTDFALSNGFIEGGTIDAGSSHGFKVDNVSIDMEPWIHALEVANWQNRAELEKILGEQEILMKQRCDRLPPNKGKKLWRKFRHDEAELKKWEDNPTAVADIVKRLRAALPKQPSQ